MKTVLLISSLVSASQVGATASAFCLRRLGVDVVMLPTTLFGRHPGWGPPGGMAVSAQTLSDMWEAILAQNIKFDAVMTGYMAAKDHIDLAISIIKTVRAENPDAKILIDPVKGDDGRLYIPETRASAMIEQLIPKADFITPNLWELEYIQASLKRLPARLITSVPDGENIGAIWEDGRESWQVSHTKFETVPHGGGDSLAALFLGRRLLGEPAKLALAKSVASVFEIMRAANALDSGELPLVRMQAFINDAIPLELKT